MRAASDEILLSGFNNPSVQYTVALAGIFSLKIFALFVTMVIGAVVLMYFITLLTV